MSYIKAAKLHLSELNPEEESEFLDHSEHGYPLHEPYGEYYRNNQPFLFLPSHEQEALESKLGVLRPTPNTFDRRVALELINKWNRLSIILNYSFYYHLA